MPAEAAAAGLRIRRAGPADVAALAEISARTFVQTFGAGYPAADLHRYLAAAYAPAAIAALLADPAMAAWLLERDGVAVGHALAGPCKLPHPEVAAGDGELRRLYLLAEAQNGSWGTRLLQTALSWLTRAGPRTLWLGVWSENHGAQRFYARHGFERVGEYVFEVGTVRDREFILRRPARGG